MAHIIVTKETKDLGIPIGYTSPIHYKRNGRGDKVPYFTDSEGTERLVEIYDRLQVIEFHL